MKVLSRKEFEKKALIGPGPHCFRCGNTMKPGTIQLGGITVRSWRCPKDGEEILHPDEAEYALMLNKLRHKGIKVKIGMLNKAPYIRFPKEFNCIFRKGDEVIVKVVDAKTMTIKILRKQPSEP